jgi:enoyl-CoA hydratase
MACDMIYADQSAVFGQPEVKLGLIPGFGGTQRLPRLVGRANAREIIYTGRNLKADEAKGLGLVVKIFADRDELIAGAESSLKEMMKSSPSAIGEAKMAINDGCDIRLSDGLEVELDRFANIFQSSEMVEGTAAFLEKRKPNFK